MTQTCDCYKKLKYLEYCYNLEKPQETEQVEESYTQRASVLNQKEKAVKLPGAITIFDSNLELPDACNSHLSSLFPEMAQILSGVEDYEYNILSFWILDLFIEGLRTAQLAGMGRRNQRATLYWMAYVYNVMQGSGSKLTRRDLFLRIKLYLLAPDENDIEQDEDNKNGMSAAKLNSFSQNKIKKMTVPFPPVLRTDTDQFEGFSESRKDFKSDLEAVDSEQSLRDMETLTEIIYHSYARLWSFFLIRSSLRSMPALEIINLPFKLNVPKKVLKYENNTRKSDKGGKRTASQRTFEEIGIARELSKNDYILPLQAAQGVETLLKELFALTSLDSIVSERDKGKQERKKK